MAKSDKNRGDEKNKDKKVSNAAGLDKDTFSDELESKEKDKKKSDKDKKTTAKKTVKKPTAKAGSAKATAKAKKPVRKTGKSKKAKKKEKDKSDVKVFDLSTVLFCLVSLIAVLALLTLAINIVSPETFRKVFYNSPLDRDGVVITVGSYDVMSDEYIYEVMQFKQRYIEEYGEDFWRRNPSAEKKLLEEFETAFINNYILFEWAKELGIEFTDADRAEVDARIEKQIEAVGGMDKFLRALDANCLTEDLFYRLEYNSAYIDKIQEAINESEFGTVSDEELKAFGEEMGLLGAKHILLTTGDDAKENAKKLELAEKILQRINNGEDFDTLMNEYSEDPGLQSNPDGYTFKPEDFVPKFTETTQSLKIGEISDVVDDSKGGYGYHIIMRIEPDYKDYYFYDEELNNYVSITQKLINDRFSEKFDELKEKTTISYGRGYSNISLDQVVFDHVFPVPSEKPENPRYAFIDENDGDEHVHDENCNHDLGDLDLDDDHDDHDGHDHN